MIARKIAVLAEVGDPGWLSGRKYSARKPYATLELSLFRDGAESRETPFRSKAPPAPGYKPGHVLWIDDKLAVAIRRHLGLVRLIVSTQLLNLLARMLSMPCNSLHGIEANVSSLRYSKLVTYPARTKTYDSYYAMAMLRSSDPVG